MELKGKSCVITGAARGLGEAIVRELHRRGAKVFVSDIDPASLEILRKELGVEILHCNVTDQDQVAALGRAAIEAFGMIDIWINNAGIWTPYVPAIETDFNRAHLLMEVNYFGTAYGMLEALRHMMPHNRGVICNILSVRSLKGKALGSAYSASKFAAEGYTQAVRDEVKDTGIKVLGVYPYRIKTGLFGVHKHEDYETSMEPAHVAKIIVDNLEEKTPAEHLEIWSPEDVRVG